MQKLRRGSRLLSIMALVLVAGCGQAGSGVSPRDDGLDRLHQQARDALARYDQALTESGGPSAFVPIGELTGQVGNWEQDNGENKAALGAGRIVSNSPLPEPSSATGVVRWDSGATQAVPVISAGEAVRQISLTVSGGCGQCLPLEVTGARMTTVQVDTTKGPATVPAWELTLAGTSVRLTRVAVDPTAIVLVTPPPWDANNPPGGLAIESAVATGARLTVSFTGSPGPASEPCGADYTAEAVESPNAVVIIVLEHRHAADEICTAIGARRSITVDLSQPLGERAVLEVQQGLPVRVTITK